MRRFTPPGLSDPSGASEAGDPAPLTGGPGGLRRRELLQTGGAALAGVGLVGWLGLRPAWARAAEPSGAGPSPQDAAVFAALMSSLLIASQGSADPGLVAAGANAFATGYAGQGPDGQVEMAATLDAINAAPPVAFASLSDGGRQEFLRQALAPAVAGLPPAVAFDDLAATVTSTPVPAPTAFSQQAMQAEPTLPDVLGDAPDAFDQFSAADQLVALTGYGLRLAGYALVAPSPPDASQDDDRGWTPVPTIVNDAIDHLTGVGG